MPSSSERESATRDSESSSHSNSVDDVFQRFKKRFPAASWSSQTMAETQKPNRATQAEKLKLAGKKDQFLIISELSNAVGELGNFLAAKDIPKAHDKLAQLSKSFKHR